MNVIGFPGTCEHSRIEVGPLEVEICPADQSLNWFDGTDRLDPQVAMARLFGEFNLMAVLPGLHSPGHTVLVYQPPSRRHLGWMLQLPSRRWVEAVPGLWLTHDGSNLHLSSTDPMLEANLLR